MPTITEIECQRCATCGNASYTWRPIRACSEQKLLVRAIQLSIDERLRPSETQFEQTEFMLVTGGKYLMERLRLSGFSTVGLRTRWSLAEVLASPLLVVPEQGVDLDWRATGPLASAIGDVEVLAACVYWPWERGFDPVYWDLLKPWLGGYLQTSARPHEGSDK